MTPRRQRLLSTALGVVAVLALGGGVALAAWVDRSTLQATASAAYRQPHLLRVPHIVGSAVDTRTLTAVPGEWANLSPSATRTWTWLRCAPTCTPLAGQAGSTYTLPAGTVDSGARYVVRETVTNVAATATASAVSLPTVPHVKGSVALGLLTYVVVNLAPPVVAPSSTPPPVLSTVTANDGEWDAMSLLDLGSLLGLDFQTASRQWLRCGAVGSTAADTPGADGCSPITDATGSSYVVSSADRGQRLRVRVTLSGRPLLGSNSTAVVVSQATEVVP